MKPSLPSPHRQGQPTPWWGRVSTLGRCRSAFLGDFRKPTHAPVYPRVVHPCEIVEMDGSPRRGSTSGFSRLERRALVECGHPGPLERELEPSAALAPAARDGARGAGLVHISTVDNRLYDLALLRSCLIG